MGNSNKGSQPSTKTKKRKLKYFTSNETEMIMEAWKNKDVFAKRELAKKLGRTMKNLGMKYYSERAKRAQRISNEKITKKDVIAVTHVSKPAVIANTNITVDGAVIEIPSRNFTVNNIRITF